MGNESLSSIHFILLYLMLLAPSFSQQAEKCIWLIVKLLTNSTQLINSCHLLLLPQRMTWYRVLWLWRLLCFPVCQPENFKQQTVLPTLRIKVSNCKSFKILILMPYIRSKLQVFLVFLLQKHVHFYIKRKNIMSSLMCLFFHKNVVP